jgi:hypothetical protein
MSYVKEAIDVLDRRELWELVEKGVAALKSSDQGPVSTLPQRPLYVTVRPPSFRNCNTRSLHMKLTTILLAGAIVLVGAGYARAQDLQAEKTLVANERAINDAVEKGNVAAFTQYVAADGWSVDGTAGRMSVADFLKGFDQMTKGLKITSWDMTDSMVQWVDATTAVHSYKWTVKGTYQGQAMPSPVWVSTVWTKKNGKWMAMFHQESVVAPQPTK